MQTWLYHCIYTVGPCPRNPTHVTTSPPHSESIIFYLHTYDNISSSGSMDGGIPIRYNGRVAIDVRL